MRTGVPYLCALCCCIALSGCISQSNRSQQPDTGEDTADAPPVLVEDRSTSAATDTLLASANAASSQQDYANAIVYLERAVRIEPRNTQLWLQLSAAHLRNQNLVAATQHCRKAIALAGQDKILSRSAWLLLADIKEAEGNEAEAEALRRQYRNIPT